MQLTLPPLPSLFLHHAKVLLHTSAAAAHKLLCSTNPTAFLRRLDSTTMMINISLPPTLESDQTQPNSNNNDNKSPAPSLKMPLKTVKTLLLHSAPTTKIHPLTPSIPFCTQDSSPAPDPTTTTTTPSATVRKASFHHNMAWMTTREWLLQLTRKSTRWRPLQLHITQQHRNADKCRGP